MMAKPKAKRKSVTFPVSRPALLARINRRLRPGNQQLRASRSERARSQVGDFYVVDVERNFMVDDHVDPVELATRLGVLNAYEVPEGFDRGER
jgi:hypothetical protein